MKTNRRYVVSVTSILALLMLAGCSSAKMEEVKEETATGVVTEVDAETIGEEVTQLEVAEEMAIEDVQYETPEAWVESLQLKEPTIVIWNSETMENTVLQESQEYQLKENDQILLTLGGRMNSFNCEPMNVFEGFEPFKQLYLDIFLDIVGKQEITFELDVNGEMYTKTATFIAASSNLETDMVDWETWASQPDNTDICFVVWNENTTTQIVEKEEKWYEYKEGDRIAIPYRENLISVLWKEGEKISLTETESGGYYEINISENEKVTRVMLKYNDENGEMQKKMIEIVKF